MIVLMQMFQRVVIVLMQMIEELVLALMIQKSSLVFVDSMKWFLHVHSMDQHPNVLCSDHVLFLLVEVELLFEARDQLPAW